MKNHNLKIEKPCREDWNKMAPNQLGRHCQLCEKTVVDFTKMSSEEIKEYLLKKSNERICGRIIKEPIKRIPSKKEQWFNGLQLKINQRVGFIPIRVSLISMLSVLMVLLGCNQNTAEKKLDTKENSPITSGDSIANDSTQRIDELHTVGNIAKPEPLMGDIVHELGEVDEQFDEIPVVGKIAIEEDVDRPK
ncbi:hypothetical protein OAM07_01265 [Crocinitomicaceae bacterium]|jgi:hypothetical protein|nr:hypothetical protein [Crocinitomicaceae bacterium]MDC0459358.1 hypothetical protein [Crocinitomicaceae bacterium]MDO7610938.1 hypothetical protein [Crocinitomicaceae bacterium]